MQTDDDEDTVACRTTHSAQVVLHDRLITDAFVSSSSGHHKKANVIKKSAAAPPPPPPLSSLIFCSSSVNNRQQQQQQNVYSITIDSRGQVEIVQDCKPVITTTTSIIIPGRNQILSSHFSFQVYFFLILLLLNRRSFVSDCQGRTRISHFGFK